MIMRNLVDQLSKDMPCIMTECLGVSVWQGWFLLVDALGGSSGGDGSLGLKIVFQIAEKTLLSAGELPGGREGERHCDPGEDVGPRKRRDGLKNRWRKAVGDLLYIYTL